MAEVDVIIEISKGGHIKYEYDKERNILNCDRILHTPMKYPFNYGFIPNTLSEDSDPLDVVVLMDDELVPGSLIKCKILGYLETKDDAGNDPKIIVCPIGKVDPMWNNIDDLMGMDSVNLINNSVNKDIEYLNKMSLYDNDKSNLSMFKVNVLTLYRIKYFFEHYKDLENKKVEVGNFYNKEHAVNIYKCSLERFKTNKIYGDLQMHWLTNSGNLQKTKITDFFERIK